MTRTLLLDVRDAEERRAALLEDGAPTLLWVEREDDRSLVGNVYLGRVVRVEPSIGAAFVDLGLDRPGFLPAEDTVAAAAGDLDATDRDPDAVGPEDGDGAAADRSPDDGPAGETAADAAPPPTAERRIEDVVRPGDTVVVQVARDAVGRKGPTLTMQLSYAGRTLVLIPGLGRRAVSRRIVDPARRAGVEARLAALALCEGVGVVARTASEECDAGEMAEDAARLVAIHLRVRERAAAAEAPALLHEDSDFLTRAIRELAMRAPEGSTGPLRIVTDDAEAVERARALTAGLSPPAEVVLHPGAVPLFHAFGVERAVRALADPRVPLPGGASLVIHETEAMWSVDVNSGRLREGESLEATALATDLLAAKEVARQIRLRDLSGLIVVDFIDCREPAHRTRVEEAFRAELAKDPARLRMAPLSEFMAAEITRRRLRSGPARSGSLACPCCGGRGRVQNPRAAGLAALRDVRALLAEGAPHGVVATAADAVAADLERRIAAGGLAGAGGPVTVRRSAGLGHDRFEVRRA